MKRMLQSLGFVTLLALALYAGPADAQNTATATTSTIPLRYDVSKEVTLSATVQGKLTQFTLSGKDSLSISAGEQLQVTGVMTTTLQNKQVFLIRTIQMNGHTYAIRNERGFPLAHPARNLVTATESKGGQL